MREVFKDIYQLDNNCYENGLNEYILMENAGRAIYEEIVNRGFNSVLIISGSGNNGADGIAVARMLLKKVPEVKLFLPMGVKSEMAKFQFEIYKNYGGEFYIDKLPDKKFECYVDAIFGVGLKRALSPQLNFLIKTLNKKEGFKIACDIPTGLSENGVMGEVFKSDLTVTMGAEKISLYNDFAKEFVGKIVIAELGISFQNYISESDTFLLEKRDMELPFRNRANTHKGDFGHMGVLVGEKEGAGVLAGLAGLNFGAGLVTAITKEKIAIPYELMHSYSIDKKFDSLVLGMGIGNFYDDELKEILEKEINMVIDADLFYKKEIVSVLNKRDKVVLTPHPKEFASFLKLLGMGDFSVEEIQKRRFFFAKKFSEAYPNSVLLLKGANTIIAYKKRLYINSFGTPALSKGGSGDILAGMIGALLAQGYHPLKSAITASLAHSFAGDVSPNYSLTPLKIVENLSKL
jgi:hydroxyethylthiazole kinase-like uncharacterized protein yjeF